MANHRSFKRILRGAFWLVLRAMPFILLLRARWAPHYAENLIYGCALFVVCSVAPLFGAYGIQCVLAYIAGIANQKSLLYKFAPRNRQPLIALARVSVSLSRTINAASHPYVGQLYFLEGHWPRYRSVECWPPVM